MNAIRVRPVQGRTVDPFRGTVEDGPQRLASREAETQPFDDVLAALEAMALVRVQRQGRRLGLRRGEEALKVAFVSAAPRVSLDDLVLEGDGRLALAVLHALLPLFGPVEIQIGRFEDLVDGHEPLARVIERFDAWFIEDSLRVAKKLEAQAAAKAMPVAPDEAPRRPRRVSVEAQALIAVALLFTLVIGGPLLVRHLMKHDVGESCDRNKDCASERCLPRAPVEQPSIGGITLTARAPADTRGVCTELCSTDSDCPTAMACVELVQLSNLGIGVTGHTKGCIPPAWILTDD